MSVLRKRNLLIVIAALVVIVTAGVAIWAVPKLMHRSTSVNGQVTAYLLNDRGEVDGLLLASGDQLHFSPQTGAIVASQIRAGDQVTATGHAGAKSSYGREVRVESISADGRTITEAAAGPPRPHGPHDKGGPRDREDGPDARTRPDAQAKPAAPTNVATNDQNAKAATSPSTAPSPVPSPEPSPETFKAAGTIGTHLVNGHGDVDGLILSTGEQVRFSPKIGELIIAAEQGGNAQVSVEGSGVRNERGTVIRPTQITVGTQTIAVTR
jgi:hypothetical protein